MPLAVWVPGRNHAKGLLEEDGRRSCCSCHCDSCWDPTVAEMGPARHSDAHRRADRLHRAFGHGHMYPEAL